MSQLHLFPGFRFSPTEEELLSFYLPNKLENKRDDIESVIPVIDLYSFDPWQLPQMSGERASEEWFFFCPRQEREAHGGRPARTTPSGYWKATGSPGRVYSSSNRVIGGKKTMVFYRGRAPTGTRTNWKMNEYRAIDEGSSAPTEPAGATLLTLRNEYSLCRVYIKTGSIRSFDRRPSAVVTSDQDRRHLHAASSSSASPLVLDERVASSHGSSSSADDGSQRSAAGGGDIDEDMLQNIDWEWMDLV